MRPSASDDVSLGFRPDLAVGTEEKRAGTPSREDCRTCEMRARCISYGWRSPAGIWFEHAVVLRPRPGCRGFEGRGDDIRDHFVERNGIAH